MDGYYAPLNELVEEYGETIDLLIILGSQYRYKDLEKFFDHPELGSNAKIEHDWIITSLRRQASSDQYLARMATEFSMIVPLQTIASEIQTWICYVLYHTSQLNPELGPCLVITGDGCGMLYFNVDDANEPKNLTLVKSPGNGKFFKLKGFDFNVGSHWEMADLKRLLKDLSEKSKRVSS